MFVSFSHIAEFQIGFLIEHLVHHFMQVINVTREGVAAFHVAHPQRHHFEIVFQIDSTEFARQYMLQLQNKIAIVFFVLCGRIHGVIEAHGVQIVPHTWPPDGGKHAVAAFEMLFVVDKPSILLCFRFVLFCFVHGTSITRERNTCIE